MGRLRSGNLVRNRETWRVATVLAVYPKQVLVDLGDDVVTTWDKHYCELIDPHQLDLALMMLHRMNTTTYQSFLERMMGWDTGSDDQEG